MEAFQRTGSAAAVFRLPGQEHAVARNLVDFTVVFDKASIDDYFVNYFDFKFALEELLHRDVDLVEYEAIHNPYFKKEVDATRRPIYG